MIKLKIAITTVGSDAASSDIARQICEDTALLELCTPVFGKADAQEADAQVLVPTTETAPCPTDAVEILVTDKTNIILLGKEPTAEDIAKLRDILERDFDLRSPRIAIVQETSMQVPDLATQVTADLGINTYGPLTREQLQAEDAAHHFDAVILADNSLAPGIVSALTPAAPTRVFAGRQAVVTAAYRPLRPEETDEELTDISCLTHPIYTAIDIVRNRAFYDEARQNPLPKLFRDKRDDRKKEDAPRTNNDNNTEQPS